MYYSWYFHGDSRPAGFIETLQRIKKAMQLNPESRFYIIYLRKLEKKKKIRGKIFLFS
jgi:hypothetical protein